MKSFFKNLMVFVLVVLVVITVTFGGILVYFPTSFKQDICNTSANFNFKTELIFALIKAESNFNCDAISKKGAVGLMQIMPTTAVWVVQELEMENFSVLELTNAQKNILIGVKYLSYLQNKFNDIKTTLCAYNAGEAVVLNWLDNKNYSSDGITLKYVPYRETENFYNRIMLFEKVYKFRLKLSF